jgi:hypothetical protein
VNRFRENGNNHAKTSRHRKHIFHVWSTLGAIQLQSKARISFRQTAPPQTERLDTADGQCVSTRSSRRGSTMLSDQEIVRRLKALRYSPQGERYARRAPSLNAVTEASGLSQARIYQIIRQGTVGAYSRLKLNQAFSTLDRERERTRV